MAVKFSGHKIREYGFEMENMIFEKKRAAREICRSVVIRRCVKFVGKGASIVRLKIWHRCGRTRRIFRDLSGRDSAAVVVGRPETRPGTRGPISWWKRPRNFRRVRFERAYTRETRYLEYGYVREILKNAPALRCLQNDASTLMALYFLAEKRVVD